MSIRRGHRRFRSAHRSTLSAHAERAELVSALQTGLYGQGDVAGLLENEIVNVYGAALVDLASLDNNALFCVACLMILMGEGNIAELGLAG